MQKLFLNFVKGVLLTATWVFSLCLSAQDITVTGTVTDTNEATLIGVSLRIQGTSSGTVTDIDGNWVLSNVPSDAILEVSYMGMVTQNVQVNGRSRIDIVLLEDVELLEEVVVVGYGTQ